MKSDFCKFGGGLKNKIQNCFLQMHPSDASPNPAQIGPTQNNDITS